MNEKEITLIQNVMDKLNEHEVKLNKILDRLDNITKTNEYEKKALDILKERKKMTKKELMESLCLSYASNKIWKLITDYLRETQQVNIHEGTGRAETFLIYLNNDSILSKASKLFLILQKKRDYFPAYVCELFQITPEEATKVINQMNSLFPGRIKTGHNGIFKRIY